MKTEGADRPAGNPKSTRSVVMAPHGIVATSHTLAAQVGIDILKKGGNAVDAAIAANAVIGATEPMSCGIGGDLFAIVWNAKDQKLYGLNASGRSPYATSINYFKSRGLKEIPIKGPLSWSVPGCVSGWEALKTRFGTMEFKTLLQPAIDYCEQGFPVTEIIGSGWKGSEILLRQTPNAAKTYLKNGRAPEIGEMMTNLYLARTYRSIAKQGARVFYSGSIADEIVEYSRKTGGLFSKKDFSDHTASWIDPVSTSYRGYDVWELPPNGQGIAALQILNLLEPYDISAMGHNSPEFLHRFIEAKKLAFADRAKFYTDPEVEKNLPIAELISKAYADERRKLIDLKKAARVVPAGDPILSHGDTIYMTVVDKDRNAVSLIQSVYYGWGSGHVPGNLGFMLQNRGCLFALDPNHLNALKPHKRPFHTIIPAMVTKDNEAWLSFGVMGGDMQPQGHVQVLMNMIDHGMNVQEAGDAARVRHFGSDSPTGSIMSDGGEVQIESGIDPEVKNALESMGHTVRYSKGAFGGYQAIRIDREQGILHGGSDPRKDGAAIGY